jgi:general stress protein 26
VWRKGRFWLTATSQRARMHAIRRDPRCCIVVTSTGSPLSRNKAITWKGICTLHDDREIKDWFYPELAAALQNTKEDQDRFAKFLDSPRRLVMEVEPTQRIGYDGAKMRQATIEWMMKNT